MNTHTNVDHHDGVLFVKVQADSGITYLALDPSEVATLEKNMLIRHGNHENGKCGYYPAWLLFADPVDRGFAAWRSAKQPPSDNWIERSKARLREAGAAFIH